MAKPEINESVAILVRSVGYIAWYYQHSINNAFDYVNTLKVGLKEIQLAV
ncbi:hypothetical protein [Acinetobacter variabilis]|nr:hypothetical protein [Acinetobacter variabilis]